METCEFESFLNLGGTGEEDRRRLVGWGGDLEILIEDLKDRGRKLSELKVKI